MSHSHGMIRFPQINYVPYAKALMVCCYCCETKRVILKDFNITYAIHSKYALWNPRTEHNASKECTICVNWTMKCVLFRTCSHKPEHSTPLYVVIVTQNCNLVIKWLCMTQ